MAVGAAAAAGAGAAAGAPPGAVEAAVGFGGVALRGWWPRVLQVLQLIKEHGLILAALLGLSAFFSMAETSITTLWPWKVRAPTLLRPIFFFNIRAVGVVISLQTRNGLYCSFCNQNQFSPWLWK
jgi:hypothetical protein